MKRTAERILGIASVVINFLSLIFLMIYILTSRIILSEPLFEKEMMNSFNTPGMAQENVEVSMELLNTVMLFMSNIGWLFVVITSAAIVLGIIGAVKVNKNSKSAGILFVIGGVLSGILTLPGILLLVAGLLCFVHKPKEALQQVTENIVDE